MTRNLALPILLALAVAACGTPQEQCISRNTSELRTVTRLLEEVEGNLARGYAWEEREVSDTVLTTCRRVVRDKDGNAHVIHDSCWRDITRTERYRVAIDPAAEARKAEGLRTRKGKLEAQVPAILAACKEAFPEES